MSEVRLHIGVNGLFENAYRFALERVQSAFAERSIVSHEKYKSELQSDVDSQKISPHENPFVRTLAGRPVVISRPKLLLMNRPLNQSDVFNPLLYKLANLQSMFINRRITVELFLADHTSYLARHLMRKPNSMPEPDAANLSWLPLIEGVLDVLHSNSTLLIWNAEDGHGFLSRFYAKELALPRGSAEELASQYFMFNEDAALEEDAVFLLEQSGWPVEALDDAYVRDLNVLTAMSAESSAIVMI